MPQNQPGFADQMYSPVFATYFFAAYQCGGQGLMEKGKSGRQKHTLRGAAVD
jgi:hypothetical protein